MTNQTVSFTDPHGHPLLAGATVEVLVDGAVYTQAVVDAHGGICFARPGKGALRVRVSHAALKETPTSV
jgi:hypothetical protein